MSLESLPVLHSINEDNSNMQTIEETLTKLCADVKKMQRRIKEIEGENANESLLNGLKKHKFEIIFILLSIFLSLTFLKVKEDHFIISMQAMKSDFQTKLEQLKNQFQSQLQTFAEDALEEQKKGTNRRTDESEASMEQKLRSLAASVHMQMLSEVEEKLKAEVVPVSLEVDELSRQFEEQMREKTWRDVSEIQLRKKVFQLEKLSLMERAQVLSINSLGEHFYHRPDYSWRIKDVKNKLRDDGSEWESPVFQLNWYPLTARAKLRVEDEFVYISLRFLSWNKSLNKLKVIPAVCFVVKDQSDKENKMDIAMWIEYAFNSDFDLQSDFERFIELKEKLKGPPYNVDDSIVIEIYMEHPLVSNHVYSRDGSVSWVLDQYQRRKVLGEDLRMPSNPSPYFYTSVGGYRVSAKAILGNKIITTGDYFQFEIGFVTGENDEELLRSFPHRTTATLIHPTDPSKNIVQSVEKNIADEISYLIDMGHAKDVKNLVFDDTLLYKIQIEAI